MSDVSNKGLQFEFEPGSIRADIIRAQADKIDELRALLADKPNYQAIDTRTMLAGMALQGLLSGPDSSYVAEAVISQAVGLADALLAELAKKDGDK